MDITKEFIRSVYYLNIKNLEVLDFERLKQFASLPEWDKCRALPFFYVFLGCDTVSSFYGHDKTKNLGFPVKKLRR